MAVSLAESMHSEGTLVSEAFGGRVMRNVQGPGVASHDGRGTRFVFVPEQNSESMAFRYALDIEDRNKQFPRSIAERLGCAENLDEACRRWTGLEVIAKLTNVPVHCMLLHAAVLPFPEGAEVHYCYTTDYWIAVGRRNMKMMPKDRDNEQEP